MLWTLDMEDQIETQTSPMTPAQADAIVDRWSAEYLTAAEQAWFRRPVRSSGGQS